MTNSPASWASSVVSERPPIRVGIIGGSGLGDALGAEQGQSHWPDTPFGKPSSPIVLKRWKEVPVAILQRHGPGHVLNPSSVPYRANIFALKQLGVTHIVASGATGSLREEIQPGHLVIVDQIIDKTTLRANTFFEHAAVHVELADPFCPILRQWLLGAARKMNTASMGTPAHVHEQGTYICMEGPAFSTRAESRMHRAWGGDLIGMTAMPEARLAREAELPYALIGLPTDYDCWRPHDPATPAQALLAEIIGNLQRASAAGIALLKQALEDVSELHHPSPAQSALQLGIWSDKKKIPPEEVHKLAILWGRYF